MSRRFWSFFAIAGIELVALVLAHQLVYLARYGSRYGEELAHSGHGGTWAAAVESSVVLALLLAIAGVLRLARLGWLLRKSRQPAPAPATASMPLTSLLRAWRDAATWLLPLTAGLLTIQENIERWSIHQPLPGPAVLLTPEYAGGLWIAIGVTIAVAFVVALFRWRREILLARLRAARRAVPRTVAATPRRSGLDVLPPADSLLGRRSALRAPPATLEIQPAG
jgi:hypothetical protein